MRAQGLRRWRACLLIIPLAGGVHAAGQAQSKRRELSAIQKELEATRREIEENRRLEGSLGRELQTLEDKNSETRKKMNQIQRNIRSAEGKRSELRSRLGALGRASGFWREGLAADLRNYALAAASRNEAFGTADLWADNLRRAAILEKAELIGGLSGVSRKIEISEAEARRRSQELLEKSRKVAQEQKSRQEEYQRKKAAIAETQERVAAAVKRVQELEESARALTRLLRNLGKERGYRRKRGAPASLELARHSLRWPAEGSVVRPFGRERNLELNTWVIHQGMLLATRPQAEIEAVEDGRVIFSGPFRSYGQVVIVDHGSNFFSIYGELGEILKSKGAEVRAGEAIARAGQGARGGSLYLEIRRGTEALDPLIWLQRK